MAANVTNAQIADAIRGLGYNLPEPLDLTGAQNTEWVRKLVGVLQPMLPAGQYADDIFKKGKDVARKLADIDPGAAPMDKLTQTLTAYGLSDDQRKALADEATKIRKTGGGLYDQSKPFSDQEAIQAVSNLLGNTPMVQAATRAAGFTLPPPAQGSAGEKITPPPASIAPAPGIPTPDKIGPKQGAAAVAQTQATAAAKGPAAPTTPAAGSTAGGGGGPNNQPAPPATWNDDQIRDFIKANFGANAYFVDIPEVFNALKDVVKSGKGVNGLEAALEGTQFWQQNDVSQRAWIVKSGHDPAQARADVAQQTQAIQKLGLDAGITIDPVRAQEMAQSYLRNGWTQTDLQNAIGAEWHYDPASKNQAAAVSKMKQDAKNWLVPLSDQAIQTWGQGLISGTTTDAQYQQYLRDNAKSLLPQLSDLIDAHQNDPTFTVDHFVDPYRTTAANMLGVQADQIDFADPKWRKALDQVDPKTNTRRIMSLSEWQSTIKSDPTYGYDKTANGIQDGVNLAQQLKQSMGF
jgi:hypothetical protein